MKIDKEEELNNLKFINYHIRKRNTSLKIENEMLRDDVAVLRLLLVRCSSAFICLIIAVITGLLLKR